MAAGIGVKQHVVIVDDQNLNLRVLRSIAARVRDVKVHPFLSSSAALAWCSERDVDCFVLDYHMPAPDGLEMIRRIRAYDRLVPIVIVTSETDRDVIYRAFDLGANDFIHKPVDVHEFRARLGTLLDLRAAQKALAMRIESLEGSLRDSEERSREHAERLEAVWRIANDPNLQDDAKMLAMLERGAAAIRPGQPFRGLLARVENGNLRLEWAAETRGYADPAGTVADNLGRLVPTGAAVGDDELRVGVTRSWDDIQATEDVTPLVVAYDWHAVIRTTFAAGGSSYLLSFVSNVPMAKPFGPEDHAYVEILAAFFAAHHHQQWQSGRLAHQFEHDSLTGLWNRSRFRSLGRAAFRSGEPSAIAIFDLIGFHRINETHGHLTGDAVLVEVAAALNAQAREGEIVARVGGDSFGIFFPNASSREWVAERVATYAAVFGRPMSIGDREGKETVPARAAFGLAFAPADAATFDEALFRAEGRAGTTGAAGAR
jgi:diguanylate cyclase (GGDEF)-like protein